MIFIHSFSVFVVTLPSISHFCTFFHLPLPSTPVLKSLSVYFLLFWCWYFLTYLTSLLLLFCPALSILLLLLFFFLKKNSVLCSYLLSLGLLIAVLCSLVLICFLWDCSLLDLCSLGTFLGLGWVEILLLLLLCIGFWGELADQGEAQWSPTSLASLHKCLPVAIGPLSGHSV